MSWSFFKGSTVKFVERTNTKCTKFLSEIFDLYGKVWRFANLISWMSKKKKNVWLIITFTVGLNYVFNQVVKTRVRSMSGRVVCVCFFFYPFDAQRISKKNLFSNVHQMNLWIVNVTSVVSYKIWRKKNVSIGLVLRCAGHLASPLFFLRQILNPQLSYVRKCVCGAFLYIQNPKNFETLHTYKKKLNEEEKKFFFKHLTRKHKNIDFFF